MLSYCLNYVGFDAGHEKKVKTVAESTKPTTAAASAKPENTHPSRRSLAPTSSKVAAVVPAGRTRVARPHPNVVTPTRPVSSTLLQKSGTITTPPSKKLSSATRGDPPESKVLSPASDPLGNSTSVGDISGTATLLSFTNETGFMTTFSTRNRGIKRNSRRKDYKESYTGQEGDTYIHRLCIAFIHSFSSTSVQIVCSQWRSISQCLRCFTEIPKDTYERERISGAYPYTCPDWIS